MGFHLVLCLWHQVALEPVSTFRSHRLLPVPWTLLSSRIPIPWSCNVVLLPSFMSSGEDVKHPFAHSKNLLVVVRNDKVDLNEEIALYNSIIEVSFLRFKSSWSLLTIGEQDVHIPREEPSRARVEDTLSIHSKPFSENDIWLADNSLPMSAGWDSLLGPSSPSASRSPFARQVSIDGWSVVGDKGKSPIRNEKGGFVGMSRWLGISANKYG